AGAQLAVSLKLLDVKSGAVERSVNESVPKRELAAGNVNASAARWFAELVPVEAKPVLTVSSEPSGASASVDGNPVGHAPLTLLDLSAGSHTVTVTAGGRIAQTRTVELRAGTSSELAVALEAEKAPPVVAQPRPTPVAQPRPTPEPPVVPTSVEKPQ